jgi:hypothetical protein
METDWTSDWLWSLPLIAFTMIPHVLVPGFVFRLVVEAHDRAEPSSRGVRRSGRACW